MLGCDPKEWKFDSSGSPWFLVSVQFVWWCVDGVFLLVISLTIIFIFSWVWNKDLCTRFIGKMRKTTKRFLRAVFKDSGIGVQQAGLSFGFCGLCFITLNLVGHLYWYNWGVAGRI